MELTPEKIGFLNMADTDVLVAVMNGKIDLNELAAKVLANRGLNKDGAWVGFAGAAKQNK